MKIFRVLFAVLIVADGVATAIYGRHILSELRGSLPNPFSSVVGFFQRWPDRWLRVGGVFQALVGLGMFLILR